MSAPSPDMTALYNSRPIILWVEDSVARTYLGECWNDADIGFRIAGGNEGVRTIVHSAQQGGFGHVFGFVDRDFGSPNRPHWHDPAGSPVFVPDVHETENYLLEPDHLAGCDLNNGHRSAPEIDARVETCATGMLWWMACRQVLTDLRAEFLVDFPGHSRVTDRATAEQHICGSPWYQHLRDYLRTVTPKNKITHHLTAAHTSATTALASGHWRQSFSGKELLRDLHNWLYTPPSGGATTAAERDRDLARSIARWQVANRAVPVEVMDLRAGLRTRVGL